MRGILTVALERRAEKALSHVSEREQCEERVDAISVSLSGASSAYWTFTRLCASVSRLAPPCLCRLAR